MTNKNELNSNTPESRDAELPAEGQGAERPPTAEELPSSHEVSPPEQVPVKTRPQSQLKEERQIQQTQENIAAFFSSREDSDDVRPHETAQNSVPLPRDESPRTSNALKYLGLE